MTTLEHVEKLRAMANISYDEARTALDAANGDLLEAIIYLEKQGKISAPSGGGYYSSEKTIDPTSLAGKEDCWDKHKYSKEENGFLSALKRIGRFLLALIRRGNANTFEVYKYKGQESIATFPVTVLALLVVFAFWITLPLLLIGLFFGLRYRFKGPDFSGRTINEAMESAADAAENLKKSIKL